MNFGEALHELRAGRRLARKNWNGKDLFIKLQVPDENSKMTRPYIYISNMICREVVKGDIPKVATVVPWLASQTDMLSDDWFDIN